MKSNYIKYALGEITLVVIGILIALNINNWNEHRKDRKEEQLLLKALKEEFMANDSIILEGLKKHELHMLGTTEFLKLTGPNSNLKLEDISGPVAEGASYAAIDIVQSHLISMLNTGKLDLIRNQELKTALSSYQTLLNDYLEQELVHTNLVLNIIRPRSAEYIALASIDPSLNNIVESRPSDFRGYARDPQTQNDLVSKVWLLKNWVIPRLKKLQSANSQIKKLLLQEIKN